MPCRDDGYHDDSQSIIDSLTKMLCEVCEDLDADKRIHEFSSDIQIWWKQHKEADERRQQEEEAETDREKARRRKEYNKLREEFG